MKRLIPGILCAGLLCAALPAMADDPPSSAGSNPSTSPNSDSTPPATVHAKHMMKECMAKARQANNGMSEQDMKKTCKDQIKAKMDNPDDNSQPYVPAH
jgi:hypothetical protein